MILPIVPQLNGGVLVASPSTSLRAQVLQSFENRRPVQEAFGGAEALVKLESGDWQVLYLDRRLPDLDAEELIEIIKRRFPGIQVVMLDSDSDQESAECPASDRASSGLPAEPSQPPSQVHAEVEPLPGMIGSSEPMRHLYRLTRLIARRNTTVLIVGATGTGKELVARAVHELSPRAARPFVVVNCAAIPEALLESELFGFVRGAFTGAFQAQIGRIQAAQGGTLFLDEVGELPLGMQAKLLRFLERKEVQRLGSAAPTCVDVRVVAATNAELAGKVTAGVFREDLYYRLAAFPLEVPSLAERVTDIVPLARHFLAAIDAGAKCPRLSAGAIRVLEAHAWRGNVRELQHVMERAAVLAESCDTILPAHLYFPALRPSAGKEHELARPS